MGVEQEHEKAVKFPPNSTTDADCLTQKSDMFFPPQNVAISEEVGIQKSASLLTLAI
jgi:hypothetical protein